MVDESRIIKLPGGVCCLCEINVADIQQREENKRVVLKTVYKKNGDKVQKWLIEVEGDKYRTTEGFIDGAMTTSQWTTVTGKNIGKKNEKTPAAQALLEAGAKYRRKVDSGYVEDINDINGPGVFEPMLAHTYGDHKGKVTYPCYVQPKLDGMRCPVRVDGAFSRQNKPVNSVPHIVKALENVFIYDPKLVIDGELYNHELKDDFNALISIVKKLKPSATDLANSAKSMQFHVYDMFDSGTLTEAFEGRFIRMQQILVEQDVPEDIVKVVRTVKVTSEKELDTMYNTFLEQGYEGMMIRSNGAYQQRRTVNLLKRKEWLDGEFIITGMEEGVGNRAGMMGKIIMVTDSGESFEADASEMGGHKAYKEMWKKSKDYIGKLATVRYQNLTPDRKVPRFPKIICIRDYE